MPRQRKEFVYIARKLVEEEPDEHDLKEASAAIFELLYDRTKLVAHVVKLTGPPPKTGPTKPPKPRLSLLDRFLGFLNG